MIKAKLSNIKLVGSQILVNVLTDTLYKSSGIVTAKEKPNGFKVEVYVCEILATTDEAPELFRTNRYCIVNQRAGFKLNVEDELFIKSVSINDVFFTFNNLEDIMRTVLVKDNNIIVKDTAKLTVENGVAVDEEAFRDPRFASLMSAEVLVVGNNTQKDIKVGDTVLIEHYVGLPFLGPDREPFRTLHEECVHMKVTE